MDPLTLVMLVVLAALVFMMFRNSKKRQKEQAELQEKMVPGAEVMTSFGLFGTLVAVDESDNTATLEISPGATLRVHRQTLAKVVEPEAAAEPSKGPADTDTDVTKGDE